MDARSDAIEFRAGRRGVGSLARIYSPMARWNVWGRKTELLVVFSIMQLCHLFLLEMKRSSDLDFYVIKV